MDDENPIVHYGENFHIRRELHSPLELAAETEHVQFRIST